MLHRHWHYVYMDMFVDIHECTFLNYWYKKKMCDRQKTLKKI